MSYRRRNYKDRGDISKLMSIISSQSNNLSSTLSLSDSVIATNFISFSTPQKLKFYSILTLSYISRLKTLVKTSK